MKYKLQRKKKIWNLFKNEIVIVSVICISIMIGITIWLNWHIISESLNLKPIEFIAYFILLPCIVLFLLSYMTTTTKYLYRHLYIPLSRE